MEKISRIDPTNKSAYLQSESERAIVQNAIARFLFLLD